MWKVSDGIKGAAISALVQGLLLPLKVFLWNSLGFALVHRRFLLFKLPFSAGNSPRHFK